MASAPQLPLFYQDLQPLSSELHAKYKMKSVDKAPFLTGNHAIPLTVEEFPLAQRFFPIVFSAGEGSVPIALMGLNEGINVFVDDKGKLLQDDLYIPAYIRRYPFMLARLSPEAEELSLCFDPKAGTVGEFKDGEALFDKGEPTEIVKQVLGFNESFEQAGQRTAAFMQELEEMELLQDGEVAIQQAGQEQPFVYRGFRMVDEKKLGELRGDQLRKMSQSGMLPLIYAHMFSLSLMSHIFNLQVRQGKQPDTAAASVQ